MARFTDFLKEFFLVIALVFAVNFLLAIQFPTLFDPIADVLSIRGGVLRNFSMTILTLFACIPAGFLIFQKSKDLKIAFTVCAAGSALAIILLGILSTYMNLQFIYPASPSIGSVFIEYLLNTATIALTYFCIGLVGGILGVELRFRTLKKKAVK